MILKLLRHSICLTIMVIVAILISPSCNNPEETDEKPPVTDSVGSGNIPDDSDFVYTREYELDKLNYMRLKFGKFVTSGEHIIPSTTPEDIKKTIDYLQGTDNNLVIYFHGGMIFPYTAFTDPKRIKLDTTFRSAHYFPYYMLYGADPIEVLWASLPSVFSGDGEEELTGKAIAGERRNKLDSVFEASYQYNSYVYMLIQLHRQFNPIPSIANAPYAPIKISDTSRLIEMLRKEVREGESVTEQLGIAPKTDEQLIRFEHNLVTDTVLQALAEKDAAKDPNLPQQFKGTIKNRAALIQWQFETEKTLGGIRQRKRAGRDHGNIMTVTEELLCNGNVWFLTAVRNIAREGWNQQKRDVEYPFKEDANLYGGRALLDELVRLDSLWRAQGKTKKIYLVGSSTGAIMLCELLKTSAEPKYRQLRYNVIFSVPSCSFELFSEALEKSGDNIESVHLFTLSDKNDRRSSKWWARWLYPGSILFLVSSVCEDSTSVWHDKPIVGLQRFSLGDFTQKTGLSDGEKKAITEVKRKLGIINGVSRQVAWSNEKSLNHNLHNKAKNHKGVIRNDKVQESIQYVMTH